jgi:hypothetical protein
MRGQEDLSSNTLFAYKTKLRVGTQMCDKMVEKQTKMYHLFPFFGVHYLHSTNSKGRENGLKTDYPRNSFSNNRQQSEATQIEPEATENWGKSLKVCTTTVMRQRCKR